MRSPGLRAAAALALRLEGRSDTNLKHGDRLDTTVTWTLTLAPGGSHLRMAHEGFVLPQKRPAYAAMKPGWGRVLDGVERVTAKG